jgi:outer membrane protein assembly factor BamE (lipoprotein component of BamABCDE complex)
MTNANCGDFCARLESGNHDPDNADYHLHCLGNNTHSKVSENTWRCHRGTARLSTSSCKCCAVMKTICFIASLILLCFSGCSTPGSAYASAHPELSSAHRDILANGKIPGGLAVDGMTKEEVRLAVGSPAKVESFDGGEAWVYLQETFLNGNAGSASNPISGELGARQMMNEKTTVFFQGNRATHAQISTE